MTADELLQEAIFNLQKHNFTCETRHLADEAAQLLVAGRDIEARALVEKAQAMAPFDGMKGAPPSNAPAHDGRVISSIMSRLSERLAQDIANALNDTAEELDGHFGVQLKSALAPLESQLAEFRSQLQIVSTIQPHLDGIDEKIALGLAAAKEESQRFAASIESLNQAQRMGFEEFKGQVSSEMQTIAARVAAQDNRLGPLESLVQNVSVKALSIEKQMERQTGWLRTMEERQAQRAAALSAVLEGISKLREFEPFANTTEPGQ